MIITFLTTLWQQKQTVNIALTVNASYVLLKNVLASSCLFIHLEHKVQNDQSFRVGFLVKSNPIFGRLFALSTQTLVENISLFRRRQLQVLKSEANVEMS